MAMTAVLTQTSPALSGQPCQFILAVSNSGASTVTVQGIQPIVTGTDGVSLPPCNIDGPYAPIGSSTAVVGATQFNVPVLASATVYFPFLVQFFGPLIVGGGRATPNNQFQVTANCIASDGTVFGPPPLNLALSEPVFGAGGSPPNPAFVVGQLNFAFRANSGLAL